MAQNAKRLFPIILGFIALAVPSSASSQQVDPVPALATTMYAFQGAPDGSGPAAALLVDKSGDVFGTTAGGGTGKACLGGCGAVFELKPGAGGYKETILYSFLGAQKNDGDLPLGGVVADAAGTLYGTTEYQGGGSGCQNLGCGTVFKLTHTRSGYQETVLYVFKGGGDGANPTGNLIVDASGALFGTTVAGGSNADGCPPTTCGTVFKLTPNGSAYAESIIHRFAGRNDGGLPYGGLIEDATGALYGTTSYGGRGCNLYTCGTVYKLAPAAHRRLGYRKTILHAFTGGAGDGAQPMAGLAVDAAGALYGTTRYGGGTACAGGSGCGAVFKLTPSRRGYVAGLIYRFQPSGDGIFPQAPVVIGQTGAVFGTTLAGGHGQRGGNGVVFELAPAPSGGYSESLPLEFLGSSNGQSPMAGLVFDTHGVLIGTTDAGGSSGCNSQGCGVAFKLIP